MDGTIEGSTSRVRFPLLNWERTRQDEPADATQRESLAQSPNYFTLIPERETPPLETAPSRGTDQAFAGRTCIQQVYVPSEQVAAVVAPLPDPRDQQEFVTHVKEFETRNKNCVSPDDKRSGCRL